MPSSCFRFIIFNDVIGSTMNLGFPDMHPSIISIPSKLPSSTSWFVIKTVNISDSMEGSGLFRRRICHCCVVILVGLLVGSYNMHCWRSRVIPMILVAKGFLVPSPLSVFICLVCLLFPLHLVMQFQQSYWVRISRRIIYKCKVSNIRGWAYVRWLTLTTCD